MGCGGGRIKTRTTLVTSKTQGHVYRVQVLRRNKKSDSSPRCSHSKGLWIEWSLLLHKMTSLVCLQGVSDHRQKSIPFSECSLPGIQIGIP